MLEVIERFPAIGTIENYQALSAGERALFDQYVVFKHEEALRMASKGAVCPFMKKRG